jgi:hypothetical protein
MHAARRAVRGDIASLPRARRVDGEPVECKNMGAFVGNYCYVCEDLTRCDPPEDEVVREHLAGASLADLRAAVAAAVTALCAGGGGDELRALREACAPVCGKRFFDGPPRRWWLAVEERLRRAEELAAAAADADAAAALRGRRAAAHELRQLQPDPPLYRPRIRPRVFIKTFKK